MSLLKCCFFLYFVQAVLSEDILKPCDSHDIPCLTAATQNFLSQTSAGLPQYDIKPIDPVTIDLVEVNIGDAGEKIRLKNLTLSGMKNLIIHDFTMNTVNKTVKLGVEAEPSLQGTVEVVLPNSTLTGRISGKAKELQTASYTYDLIKDDKGVDYFTVGPETVDCKLESNAEVVLDDATSDVLKNYLRSDNTREKVLCEVAKKAYSIIIHNLRSIAKLYPKTSFFTDLA